MAKDKDHLFVLIESLKKTEKAYFKKIKSAFGNNDSYIMQIYNEIQRLGDYDEKKIIDKLSKSSPKESFAVKKFVLYNDILDTLAHSKAKSPDVLWQISRSIGHGIILKDKQLFHDAIRILQKAGKQAFENEFFYKQLEVNQLLIEIFRESKALTDFNALDELKAIRYNNLHISEQIGNAEKFFILADKLHRKGELLRHTSNKEISQEIENLYADELLKEESKALSKTALVCYHFIHYLKYFTRKGGSEKALYHLKNIIDLQELLERFPLRSRFVQMGNYVRMAVEAQFKEEAGSMLQRMKKIVDEEKDIFIHIFYFVHVDFFYLHFKNKESYFQFHQEIEKTFETLPVTSAFNMEIMDLKHAQFHCQFMKENFKKAYNIANFIDNQHNLHSFKNGKFLEKILKIICAYELNDAEMMAAEIRAVKYLLKTMEHPLSVELKVFETLNSLSKCDTKDDKIKILKAYKSEENEAEPKFSFLLNSFRFDLWVKSKITGSTYVEMVFA